MPKASKFDIDTIYMETAAAFGKKVSDSTASLWRNVLAEEFTLSEVRQALDSHSRDMTQDYQGKPAGEQMPTAAGLKLRIEGDRSQAKKERIYCGDSDCFGMWRDDHTQKRRVRRCEKCEALRDSQVHPVTGETYADHIKTPGYQEAKAKLYEAFEIIAGRKEMSKNG